MLSSCGSLCSFSVPSFLFGDTAGTRRSVHDVNVTVSVEYSKKKKKKASEHRIHILSVLLHIGSPS